MVFDEPLKLAGLRSDLAFYPVPFDKVIQPVTNDAKIKKLLKNMAYVGVVAQLLGLEMPEVEAAITKQFRKKAKAAELNIKAARAGHEYAPGVPAEARPVRDPPDGRQPGEDHHRWKRRRAPWGRCSAG